MIFRQIIVVMVTVTLFVSVAIVGIPFTALAQASDSAHNGGQSGENSSDLATVAPQTGNIDQSNITIKEVDVTGTLTYNTMNNSQVEKDIEVPVTIASWNKSGDKNTNFTNRHDENSIIGNDLEDDGSELKIQSQSAEVSDFNEESEDTLYGYHNLWSSVEGEIYPSGFWMTQILAEAEGVTHTAFNGDIPNSIKLTSELSFHGLGISASFPPSFSVDVSSSAAMVELEISGDEFDGNANSHSVTHDFTNAEASSYASIYGISMTDSVSYDYGTNVYTTSHEVGDDCLTTFDC